MRKRTTIVVALLMALLALSGCGTATQTKPTQTKAAPSVPSGPVSVDEAREIAKDAYIYGFPMVDSYRVQYSYFVNTASPEYKGSWNEVHSAARVFTPSDTTVQTPNSDTPYSMLGADLRSEPLVLLVPPVDKDRYYSLQFVDGYTYNFGYLGSRATGNDGGVYLLAGPGWTGDKPEGVSEVIRSDTDFALVIYRTQLLGADDLANVTKIQGGFKAMPLSRFVKRNPPRQEAVDWPTALSPDDEKTSLRFFDLLDFQLRYAPVLPTEKDIRARFAAIGLTGDGTFNSEKLSPEMQKAFKAGMADAWSEFNTFKKDKIDTGEVTSADFYGSREQLGDNYLYRMAAAVIGIYGNSKQEAIYPVLTTDADGAKLSGENKYTLTFGADQLPPVNSFWSVTMYQLPESQLVDNPINRYLINSAMLPNLTRNADGGLTIYVQNSPPGSDKQPNWLPAPPGPFTVVMRLYWPKDEALDGRWQPPKLTKVS